MNLRVRQRRLFVTVQTEGGILPIDLLERLSKKDTTLPGNTAVDYNLMPGQRLDEAIGRSWSDMKTA